MLKSLMVLVGMALVLAWSSAARAECGGNVQCIGIGTSAAEAESNHHLPVAGGANIPTLNYGNQVIATGTVRNVFVAAVTGPGGAQATVGPFTFTGADAAQFTVTGGTCQSAGPIHGGMDCTVEVTFTPTSVGVKNATIHVALSPPCGGCITERALNLTGTGTLAPPAGQAASLSVAANTPTTLDLTPFISGAGLTGIRIATAPTRGSAAVSGNSVTYTPSAGYLGTDSFTYEVLAGATVSPPATVSVTVATRQSPAAEPHVTSLVTSQAVTAQRFSAAQLGNISSRLDALHRRSSGGNAQSNFLALSPKWQQLRSLPARVAALARQPTGAWPMEPELRSNGRRGETGLQGPARDAETHDKAMQDNSLGSLMGSMALKAASFASTGNLPVFFQADNPRGADGGHAGGFWTGGTLGFGKQEASASSSGLRFTTAGVTAGYDARLRPDLVAGMGLGFAQADTTLGNDGSGSKNRGHSLSVYASYQVAPDFFFDGLLGYGNLDSQSERFVAATGAFARSDREGKQIFGSIGANYQFQSSNFMLTPYGRLEFSYGTLDRATESGAGLASLTYFEQKLHSTRAAFGIKAEAAHETASGLAVPHVRLEYGHQLSRDGDASVAYADMEAGPVFTLTPSNGRRGSLSLGAGLEFLTLEGMALGFDWNTARHGSERTDHTLRLWLATNLDDKPVLNGRAVNLFGLPVNVEAGIRWEDNVSRTGGINHKLADAAYVLGASAGRALPLSGNTRLRFSGSLEAEKFERYSGLDLVSAGLGAELNYRADGSFGTPTYGVFARYNWDETDSQMRRGYRTSTGFNVRLPVSDRIELFGILSRNVRNASSSLFDTAHTSLKLNVDYLLHARGNLYFGAEHRLGDSVSSGLAMADNAAIAKVFLPDDAFTGQRFMGYRYEARTTIWTLGYNFQLGNRDSLDFSYRLAVAAAMKSPDYSGLGGYPGLGAPGTAGSSTYASQQFTASYLSRF